MLKIKLARFGKKKQVTYRIVINEAKERRDGKYKDLIGHYIPARIPKVLDIDVKKYEDWLKKGAQPTETVASLFEKFKKGEQLMPKKKKVSRKAKALLKAKQEGESQVTAPSSKEAEAKASKDSEVTAKEAQEETK